MLSLPLRQCLNFTENGMMKIKRVVKPGLPGTKKLLRQYGDKLVCVRYRYDDTNRCIHKTAELIIETTPMPEKSSWIPANKLVYIRIAQHERRIQMKVRHAGGKWNAALQLWHLPYKRVVELGLTDRMDRST